MDSGITKQTWHPNVNQLDTPAGKLGAVLLGLGNTRHVPRENFEGSHDKGVLQRFPLSLPGRCRSAWWSGGFLLFSRPNVEFELELPAGDLGRNALHFAVFLRPFAKCFARSIPRRKGDDQSIWRGICSVFEL